MFGSRLPPCGTNWAHLHVALFPNQARAGLGKQWHYHISQCIRTLPDPQLPPRNIPTSRGPGKSRALKEQCSYFPAYKVLYPTPEDPPRLSSFPSALLRACRTSVPFIPDSISSKPERASGCRRRDLGVKIMSWKGISKAVRVRGWVQPHQHPSEVVSGLGTTEAPAPCQGPRAASFRDTPPRTLYADSQNQLQRGMEPLKAGVIGAWLMEREISASELP